MSSTKCVHVRERVLASRQAAPLLQSTAAMGMPLLQSTARTLSEDETSQCYQLLGEVMLQQELLPHRQGDSAYAPRYDLLDNIQLSKKQQSWIDHMLRKKMGGKKAALFLKLTT